ncbi:MAG TPA: hypothetical protein VEZ41_11480 [Allosphingosinicella sp.]|nr:hypothetical protein [Allosphingosinicella sp.]
MRRGDDDDYRPRQQDAPSEAPSTLGEAIDQLSRRLSGALMLAGGLIGLGLYASSGSQEAPEYQIYAADGEVFRLNLDSGSIIACNAQRCMQVLKPGQDLAEGQRSTLFTVPPAQQLPAGQPSAPAPQQIAPNATGNPAQPAAPAPRR